MNAPTAPLGKRLRHALRVYRQDVVRHAKLEPDAAPEHRAEIVNAMMASALTVGRLLNELDEMERGKAAP